jgi:hypothetical protein
MLRSATDLKGLRIRGTDGEIGSVDEFYFDDERWVIRYVVVDAGGWLGRRVLLSPISVTGTDWSARALNVSLTRDRIRKSPDADFDAPISRKFERMYYDYYAYSPYWMGAGYWGAAYLPGALAAAGAARVEKARAAAALEEGADPRLRSSREVTGYHIQATDGEIGHVDDFVIDESSWAIRYLRIDTSNWIGGKAVLIPQRALDNVDWRRQVINVRLTREQVRNSPELEPHGFTTEYEQRLDTHYRITM